jgi:proline iminopeptidase
LHVETFGKPSDPLLVLVHGGPGGDYRSLLPAKAMANEGFFVIFYDQRGTGLSKREDRRQFEGEDAVQLMIEDLKTLITHFKKSPSQKVFLMGHSWGAMLATAYLNQNPAEINGAILAEPGGLTWDQTTDYLSRSNKIKLFSEALNDAVYPEQFFSGREEHEILDYKASFFLSFENAPGSPFSGVSTRNGDLLTIKLKGCQHNNRLGAPIDVLPDSFPECMYVVLEYDAVCNVADLGVQMFD